MTRSDPVASIKQKSNKEFLKWLSENLSGTYTYHLKQYIKIRLFNVSNFVEKLPTKDT